MSTLDTGTRDVMQVCRNGHIITDLLRALPDQARSHCPRCGATTLTRCPTCGHELEGAIFVPESLPVGTSRPPQYCSSCGAAFPWTRKRTASAPSIPAVLEDFCRKLPRVVRELRFRHGQRPAFEVDEVRDLEDLVRSLLPLYFEDVRLESRLPRYAIAPRTDFRIGTSDIVLTVKMVAPEVREPELGRQFREDIAHYEGRDDCRQLIALVYDPEQLLVEPGALETQWAALAEALPVRVVIAF
jgi:hypothetical protein